MEETYIRKQILTDAIKDIEWVGECICKQGVVTWVTEKGCACCNNTGVMSRPATIQEVLDVIVDLVDVTSKTMCKHRLRINDGTLRMKENR
jgi:hypothetical protein